MSSVTEKFTNQLCFTADKHHDEDNKEKQMRSRVLCKGTKCTIFVEHKNNSVCFLCSKVLQVMKSLILINILRHAAKLVELRERNSHFIK